MRARLLAVLAASLACVFVAPAAATAATGPEDGRPQRDVRNDSATVPIAQAKERGALATKLGDEGVVTDDGVTGGVRTVLRTDGLLTAASGDDPADIALGYVRAHSGAFGLGADDLAALRLTSSYRSIDGVTHLAWAQVAKGIASYDGVLRANVTSDGRLVNVAAPLVADLTLASAQPALSAPDALAIAKRDANGALQMPSASGGSGAEQATTFSNGDTAKLVVFASKQSSRLAWRLKVAGEVPFVYDTVVDATDGRILARNSLTDFLSSASVTENYPGAPLGGVATTQDLDGPDGTWLDISAGHTKLDGNNAHTYADLNNNDATDAGEDVPSSGGGNFVYPRTAFFPGGYLCPGTTGCSWDPAIGASKATNQNQVTTQLHYLINRFHDWLLLAPIGFDEASRNFENVHTTAAPGAGDRVRGESNDGGGVNNANFATPPDGTSPRMQMYFTDNNTAQDTGEDAAVVFHEYTHGLSNRLVGNGSGLTVHQSQAMGEGWSDWYALDYLVANGYEIDTAASGEMLTGKFSFAPNGVRTEGTDCALGAPIGICPGTVAAGSGGYTYGDLGKVGSPASPHPNGEIWAQTIWDLRNVVGAVAARCLVTGGMRLSPLAPSFLDMRDAILAANVASCGNLYYNQIWTVFAARGMGFHAVATGGASANSGQVDNFDLPTGVEHVSTTIADPAPGGDGDGFAEPGETITVVERLKSVSVGAVTGITGTMTSSTPGVTLPTNAATWPDLPASGNQADNNPPPFRVAIPASHPCGAPVQLSLSIDTDQDVAGNPTIPITVPTGVPNAPAVFTNTTPVAIPDNTPAGVTSTITVPAGAVISDLDVRIADLDHTWVGDLKMTLKGPDGTTVTLMDGPGSGSFGSNGHDFTNTVLDDEASTPIESIPPLPATDFTGSWKPDQALSAFDGKARVGTWTLTVSDNEGGDTGTLNAWALLFGSSTCSTSVGYANAVLADNPGGYWRFGEPSGTVMNDSSGHGNTGAYLNGVALGQIGALFGDPNTAAKYDGINDTGRVPDANSLDTGSSFTIEGWIKRTSPANAQELFNKGGNGLQMTVMNAASGSQVFLRKANVTTLARSAGPVAADGNYHHVVATMNGAGTAKIYIDGALDTVPVALVQAIQDTAFPLTFGSAGTTSANYDEFALYDGVLTLADIAEHYTIGHGP